MNLIIQNDPHVEKEPVNRGGHIVLTFNLS